MKRIILIYCFLILIFTLPIFSQGNNKTVTLEINNAIPNGGIVYVSVSLSEAVYKKQMPDYIFQLNPSDSIIRIETVLPFGECVINVYQDLNGNGKCDTGLFGIPKEPVGITNWDGKGPPGSYNKLKTTISNTTQTIRISLYQL
jgi:uncharacterized protein (DUF2141 family)